MPGRTPLSLEDNTPLDKGAVDVRARCGWVVRMVRLTAPGAPTLKQLAEAAGTNSARLHRLETGALRDGALLDACEEALGAETGSVRAAVDVTCRTFPADSPPDTRPGSPATGVRAVSDLTEALLDAADAGEVIAAGAWLRWSRAMAAAGAVGLPERLARPLVDRLVDELGRSVGPGYPVRYESLALLRSGPYGHLVVDAARAVVAEPDVQRVADLVSAVSEAVTADAVALAVDLLADDRVRVAEAGALAVENLAAVGPDPAGLWAQLVPSLVDAYVAGCDDPVRWEWLSHLLRLAPVALLRPHQARLPRPPAPKAAISDWSASRANAYWSTCEDLARRVCAEASVTYQPMVVRLLFDVAMSHHETRGVTSYMLVGAVPALVGPVADAVAEIAETHDDEVVRARAARRLRGALWGVLPARAEGWVDGPDPVLDATGLALAGAAGTRLDPAAYDDALADPAHRTAALFGLGMAGHPHLALLAADRPAGAGAGAVDPEVAGAARWWCRHGARVVR
ncbi:hypothetical protein [Nocardioides litoris]|uniref:hypothetical protein n=1 Tax=Nocardioides litoris TaxID=1926648 RepID=UPI00147706F6|nr:hypothetical protein [Nocardioides litoris]